MPCMIPWPVAVPLALPRAAARRVPAMVPGLWPARGPWLRQATLDCSQRLYRNAVCRIWKRNDSEAVGLPLRSGKWKVCKVVKCRVGPRARRGGGLSRHPDPRAWTHPTGRDGRARRTGRLNQYF